MKHIAQISVSVCGGKEVYKAKLPDRFLLVESPFLHLLLSLQTNGDGQYVLRQIKGVGRIFLTTLQRGLAVCAGLEWQATLSRSGPEQKKY